MSVSYCLIGGTGEGKSSLARKLTDGKALCVFDVNGEWSDLPFDLNQRRCRYFGDEKKFIEICVNKHNGTFCVLEEATGFFIGATGAEARKFIIGKRHPVEKGGRNIIFLFHTIQSVPPFILDTADFIVLFKTGDDVSAVKKKRDKLVQPFLRLQRAPKHSKIIIQNR